MEREVKSMKKNLFLKALALTLSLMLAVCSAGLAFAEDVYVENETKTIEGDVDGRVIVEALENETSNLTITGTVTEVSEDYSYHLNQAVVVSVDDNGTATVETGDINHTGGDYGGSALVAESWGFESQATVTTGDITSDNIGISVGNYAGTVDVTSGDIDATMYGVTVNPQDFPSYSSQLTAEEFAALNLGEPDQTGESPIGKYEKYIIDKDGDSAVYWHYINDDGTESFTQDLYGNGFAGETSVQVNGDITVINPSEEGGGFDVAVGVQITGRTVSSETEVAVDGDITAEAGYARGVHTYISNGSEAAVDVDGDITATGDSAYGAIFGAGDGSTTTADLTGDITVKGEGSAIGLYLDADTESEVTATMDGDIQVTGTAEDTYAVGLEAYAFEDSELTATVTGDITVEDTEKATGVLAQSRGGEMNITVVGDVTSDGTGLSLSSLYGEDSVGILPDDFEPDENDEKGWTQTDMDGNLVQQWYRRDLGDQVLYYALTAEGELAEHSLGIDNKLYTPAATEVRITGDVTAEETGAYIDLTNKKGEIDLIVDGTLSGETQSVLVSEDTIADNLTLTVWEIKANDDGNLVERVAETNEDGEPTKVEADTAIEKNIQYIIKVEPTQKDIITTQGTTEYEGYNVANEGDTVTLKVEVPDGYQIKNAFSDTDQTVTMARDADGNYYLIVPRGGAVMISVEFEKLPEPEPEPEPEEKTESEQKTEPEIIPAIQPEAAAETQPAAQNNTQTETPATQVAIMKPAEETTDTTVLKDQVEELAKTGDVLSVLPEEIKEQLPEGVSTVKETITMTLENYDPGMGAVTLKIAPKKIFTKGEKTTVVIALPDGNGGYTFFYVEGEGQEDGTLNLNIPADTAKALAGKTFVTMILE